MKRIYTISGLLLLFTFFSTFALAQNIIVKGKVTDAKTGDPLIGVTVAIQGTTTGTQTDVNGAFSLNAASNATLQVSYIGYTTQSVAVNGQTSLAILLQPSSTQLDQVVVVGYGTQRKLDVTGSVATVKGDDISKQASVNPVSALQGKVAGVQITNSGSPGASPQIKIRGTGTIYGNTNVLYVVDGVWYDDISFLAPSDIENISILKDASSTAIYGIRAANGVVLVSTKRGKTGTATVNYNGYAGWQTVTNPVKMANATEYATAINELAVSNGGSPLFADVNSYGAGTDWYKQVLRDAFVTNHNVSVNGGTEKSKYNFSVGMLNQDGNVRGNNYKRYTARLTNDYTPFTAIKLGYNVSGLYSKSNDIPGGIFRQLYAAGPVLPVYYADGTYGDPNDYNLGGGNNFNPQATLDFYNQRSQNYRFTGNAYAEVNFLKHFKIRTSFGGDIGQAEVRNYTPVYTATLAQRNNLSVLSVNRTETRNWIWENTLTYENTFAKDHRLTVLLGHTAQRYKSYNFNATAQNVPYSNGDADLYLSLGNTTGRNVTDGGSLNTALSYFARVNYAFKDRYLLNASIRQDGASQFYGNNVWGYFPSVGAGWVISKEPFMANQTIFDNLKLRASWGKVGNSGVPFNPTTLSVTQAAYLTAIFGTGQVPYTGASVNSVVPPAIFWERGVGTDIGLEAGVLNNRLTFELDFYNRKTQQAIFAIPILSSVGTGSGNIIGNQADFVNKGVEFSVNWRGTINSDFSYTVGGNVGYNKNKVLSTVTGANPIYAGGGGLANGALSTRTVLGSPIGEFYGYKVAGIFQTAAEVASSAQASSAKPGDFKYVDQNGDNIIDGKDRISLGDANPKYTFGLNTSFTYKAFDLAVDAQGVAGVSIYNANIAYRFGNENFSKDFYDNRWTGANSTNTYPSVNVGSTTNSAPNSFYVESGAYIRIRNIQLGYTLPSALAKTLRMQKVRFFANAQNPISFFKYRGFSPEIGGAPTEAGIDNNVYPLYATYNFGVNVTF